MDMQEVLSQDLPEDVSDIDILWDTEDTTVWTETDIIPEESTEPEVEEPTDEPTKEESNDEPTTEDEWVDADLEALLNDAEDIDNTIEDADKWIEEVKETVEDVKDALQENDTDTAEKLIDDLYTQVFDYATELDTLTTKNDMLQTKLRELSKANADYELQLAQSSNVSSDPKMIVLNRMYSDAIEGKDFAKDRVISTLEDMYYWLTGQTFEEKKIDEVSDANADDIVLNDTTLPTVEAPQEEEVDLNDISSIF